MHFFLVEYTSAFFIVTIHRNRSTIHYILNSRRFRLFHHAVLHLYEASPGSPDPPVAAEERLLLFCSCTICMYSYVSGAQADCWRPFFRLLNVLLWSKLKGSRSSSFKGTVSLDFPPLAFFRQSTLFGLLSLCYIFSNCFEFAVLLEFKIWEVLTPLLLLKRGSYCFAVVPYVCTRMCLGLRLIVGNLFFNC
jgi:hypothetical protein